MKAICAREAKIPSVPKRRDRRVGLMLKREDVRKTVGLLVSTYCASEPWLISSAAARAIRMRLGLQDPNDWGGSFAESLKDEAVLEAVGRLERHRTFRNMSRNRMLEIIYTEM